MKMMMTESRLFKNIKAALPLELKQALKYIGHLGHKNKARKVIIICMPKSGSTFLYKKLCRYTGYPKIELRAHSEIQEFDRLKVLYYKNFDLVDQIHCVATEYAVRQINALNAASIILHRNLFDLTLSMADFLNSEEYRRIIQRRGYANFFGGIVNRNFLERTREEQVDAIIQFSVPAYIHFFAAWKKFENKLFNKPLWLSYEAFFQDKETAFKKILMHCRLPIDDARVSRTLTASDQTRFNKGRIRKKAGGEFTAKQVHNIEAAAACFPEYTPELLSPN